MGVPAFFRWLTRKYPSVVVQCLEEKAKRDPNTDEKIPVDTTQPNPNGIEFDNLYLDMNGIIHPCTHPEDRPAPKNEDEMMLLIFEFIDRIFAIVRPRKVLYMAIDGVAPRAKMNQQRSRRFRAAKDACEKTLEIKRIKEQILSNGGTVPPDVPHDEKFDSNCITPGTPFMHKLAKCLRYYVHDRLNNDPAWKDLVVILSDANVPGEGEHKIMDFIRRQRANPDHDPNTHHVLCGADADLIMLGLATHEPYFTIIREEFRPDKPRPCEVCNQFGHETKECTGMAREKAGAYDEMANSFTPSEQNYIFLRLNILREYLQKELFLNNLPFKFDIERAIDDWVFMCFFVGNDFLPHLPSLEIRENAIDRLVNLYKSMINNAGGYLTDCGEVNLSRVQFILSGIGEVEDDIFKKRQRQENEFRQRQKDKKQREKRMRMGQDMPLEMPGWMKTGPYAPTPLGKPKPAASQVQVSNKFQELDESNADGGDEDSKRGIKRKLIKETDSDANLAKKKEDDSVDGNDVVKTKSSETDLVSFFTKEDNLDDVVTKALETEDAPVAVVEEEDPDANDPVRLWEDGWKHRYYKVKFDVSEEDADFRHKVAVEYVIGLQWVLKYYYQGVPSWNWYFPYHYAPFASDFFEISDAITNFEQVTQPFKPFEQLMAVFPAASKKHLPAPWQTLMIDSKSPIIDFYPEDFQVDLNGKKQSWQGVALLPFVDEKRLMKALVPYMDKLNEEERERNQRGNDRIFVGKSHKLYNFIKEIYSANNSKRYQDFDSALEIDTAISGGIAGKIWCDLYAIMEDETFRSPLSHMCPDLPKNRVTSAHYHDPVYDDAYVFKSCILDGAVMPESTLKPEDFDSNRGYRPNLGFNRNNDYRPNKNPTVANRILQHSLGGGEDGALSSAFGGQNSVYGTYRTSSTFTQHNNTNNNNNNYQQNRPNKYNNNYNNNGNNYNNNNRGNYNNNNNRNNYNNNTNYNNNNNNNSYNNPRNPSNNNFNNNNNNNNNNYRNNNPNNNSYNYNNSGSSNNNNNRANNYNYNNNNNNPGNYQQSNNHIRFSDNNNPGNSNTNIGGAGAATGGGGGAAGANNRNNNNNNNNNNNSNYNQSRQYNRQNTR